MKGVLTYALSFLVSCFLYGQNNLDQTNKNTLALELLASEYKNADNLIFSPSSIESCLAILWLGASDEIRSEIESKLSLNGEEGIKGLMNYYNTKKSLNTLNKVWSDYGIELKPSFRNILEDLDVDSDKLDFANNIEATRVINDWFYKSSNGKIIDFIPSEQLENASLVIGNAVYLDLDWADKFVKSETTTDDFFNQNGSVSKVSFMNKENEFNKFYEDYYLGCLFLPLIEENLEMVLIIPQEDHTLETVINKLKEGYFSTINEKSEITKLRRLSIPKFNITSNMNLKQALEVIGMNWTFSPVADYRRLSENGLFVSYASHRTILSIDEEGVEMTGATNVIMRKSGLPSFVCNRPFVILIRDTKTNKFLTVGNISSL